MAQLSIDLLLYLPDLWNASAVAEPSRPELSRELITNNERILVEASGIEERVFFALPLMPSGQAPAETDSCFWV
ncbi:hypothetical protein CNO08_21180 [Lysobacter capsici]|nr:hypothetical protein CNO08_21180 [Lysobacter capsici]